MQSRITFLFALLITSPALLSAQVMVPGTRQSTAVSEARALASINETEFRAKLGALAHDSMRGRETPSPELARAATWIAERFRSAGLKPAGDAGDFLQRFELRHVRADTMTVTVAGAGAVRQWRVGRELLLAASRPAAREPVPVVLMAGVPADTAKPFGDADVSGAAVLLVVRPEQLTGAVLNPIAAHADAAGVAVFVVATEVPAERWTQLSSRRAPMDRWLLADGSLSERHPTMFQLHYDAARELLRAIGEDPATLLAPERQGIRRIPGLTLAVSVQETLLEQFTVANVIGIIEGGDPELRDEAVIFTSHMDHVGVVGGRCNASRQVPADSICNGADDNASGTVGIIELAEAFAQLEPRRARTLIFAAFTAEERGLLGSYHYTNHPVVPLARTAAVINLDMIVRSKRDTVLAVGSHYSTLGTLLDETALAHPELRLTVKDDADSYTQSDHFPFVQRGVPALFFSSGRHADLHTPADDVERADVEQGTRILQLIFHTGLAVATASERPAWDPRMKERFSAGH